MVATMEIVTVLRIVGDGGTTFFAHERDSNSSDCHQKMLYILQLLFKHHLNMSAETGNNITCFNKQGKVVQLAPNMLDFCREIGYNRV